VGGDRQIGCNGSLPSAFTGKPIDIDAAQMEPTRSKLVPAIRYSALIALTLGIGTAVLAWLALEDAAPRNIVVAATAVVVALAVYALVVSRSLPAPPTQVSQLPARAVDTGAIIMRHSTRPLSTGIATAPSARSTPGWVSCSRSLPIISSGTLTSSCYARSRARWMTPRPSWKPSKLSTTTPTRP